MNVSLGKRWVDFVEAAVRDGRYGSVSEVVREGLRLVEEREAKLTALRATLEGSLADGRTYADADIDADLRAEAVRLSTGRR
ncbi:type II toxin-antitoxin system ParD family antitoxin, partial [Mycobacterium tuberculosis]|nr:type II toxin-antitoxin system ParD family antitoxin [Mycobacterium tuberculosis]